MWCARSCPTFLPLQASFPFFTSFLWLPRSSAELNTMEEKPPSTWCLKRYHSFFQFRRCNIVPKAPSCSLWGQGDSDTDYSQALLPGNLAFQWRQHMGTGISDTMYEGKVPKERCQWSAARVEGAGHSWARAWTMSELGRGGFERIAKGLLVIKWTEAEEKQLLGQTETQMGLCIPSWEELSLAVLHLRQDAENIAWHFPGRAVPLCGFPSAWFCACLLCDETCLFSLCKNTWAVLQHRSSLVAWSQEGPCAEGDILCFECIHVNIQIMLLNCGFAGFYGWGNWVKDSWDLWITSLNCIWICNDLILRV